MDEAVLHCARGLGAWEWASTDESGRPDVVLACAGDVPSIEALAAGDRDVSAAGSAVRILVIEAREDQEIAREVRRITGALRS